MIHPHTRALIYKRGWVLLVSTEDRNRCLLLHDGATYCSIVLQCCYLVTVKRENRASFKIKFPFLY